MSNMPAGATPTEYDDWSRGERESTCDHCGLSTSNCKCRFCDALNEDGTACENLAWDDYDSCPKHQLENAVDEMDWPEIQKWDAISNPKREVCGACGGRTIHHANCPDLTRNQGFDGYAEQ